jgi:hypothetical protein
MWRPPVGSPGVSRLTGGKAEVTAYLFAIASPIAGSRAYILVRVVVMWRWLAGSGNDPSEQLSVIGTSAPTDSADTTTPNTGPPTTTVPPAPPTTQRSTTTTVASDPQVQIRGEMKPCRYGDNCLVASFTIDGFDEHPGRFTCIYPNSQSEFSFNNDGVDEACLTGDDGDTITIEIDGVQSATISEQDLDGT